MGFLPVTILYWVVTSRYGRRINEKVPFPGKPLEHYIELKSEFLRREYEGKGKKIPLQLLHDAFFDGKAEFKGDVLDVLEYRHDWASFGLTAEVGSSPLKWSPLTLSALQIRPDCPRSRRHLPLADPG